METPATNASEQAMLKLNLFISLNVLMQKHSVLNRYKHSEAEPEVF